MWSPYMAVRREKVPALPTPPAGTACWPLGCLPQHLEFSSCPEEPTPPAEFHLHQGQRQSGLKIARQLSPGEHAPGRGRGGWADTQAPAPPLPRAVWVCSAEKGVVMGPKPPPPHGWCLQSCLGSGRVGWGSGKAPGKLEIR